MQHYASSDSLPIDNNPVESAIRPIAIGKRNCLVVDAERSGRRAPRSRACLPLPSSTDSIQHAGCLTPSRSARLAPTAGWIHCYRSRPWRVPTVHHRPASNRTLWRRVSGCRSISMIPAFLYLNPARKMMDRPCSAVPASRRVPARSARPWDGDAVAQLAARVEAQVASHFDLQDTLHQHL
nr:IS66 family transposase [Janthinobacterium sp. 1_2014MBL_MicDiv]